MMRAAFISIIIFATISASGETSTIELREGLALARAGGGGGRTVISTDAVADLIARGAMAPPKAGDRVQTPNGGAQWNAVKANSDGIFQTNGYLAFNVELPEPVVMLLEAAGGSLAYVNGEPRAGDPYSNGYLRLPVSLHQGSNLLLIASARGRVKARLLPAKPIASLDVADPTLPDVVTSDQGSLLAAVVVINSTDKPLNNLRLSATSGEGDAAEVTPVPTVAPMTVRKVPFAFHVPKNLAGEKATLSLELLGEKSLDAASVSVRVRRPTQEHRRTFISGIDGSLQYYAVQPAQKPSDANALVLTLHGAGVEAQGQADAYGAKDWATIVAATNRRPYGFDWEDIGRLDALEVLDAAERAFPHDPRRVVLTGHSMGGHGTWQVGLTFPDLFAAIGPSAGWSSFASYGGGGRGAGAAASANPVQQIFARANSPSDTMSLVRNSLMEEVYILHGDSDTNVPVREARAMRAALEKFHPRLSYHEEKGADHWWGGKCVDWPPMFATFDVVRLPLEKEMTEIEFATADPAISGRCRWATIQQQLKPLELSTINLHLRGTTVSGTTANVALLTFQPSEVIGIKQVELDGDSIEIGSRPAASTPIILSRQNDHWRTLDRVSPREKSAARGGPFKAVFANRVIFVYATAGDIAENAAAYASARMLAETLYYRGNGAVDLISDKEFDVDKSADRNVILFGNADTNSAWAKVLKGSPIEVRRGKITAGEREFPGDDLAAVFLQPRLGSDQALVGVVASTGPAGQRAADRLPYLTSGAALPDWLIVGEEFLSKGSAGVRGAGFFSNDWAVSTTDSAWGR